MASGPSKRALDLVWARDASCCFTCLLPLMRGEGGYSVHHRRPRGMGGSKDPVANSPANLLLLCGTGTTGCHGVIERFREDSIRRGLIVMQGRDPASVPIKGYGPFDVRLGSDGRKGHVIDGTVMWHINPLARGLRDGDAVA